MVIVVGESFASICNAQFISRAIFQDMNIPSTNLIEELENWANGGDLSEVPSNPLDMVKKYDAYWEEILNRKMAETLKF